jgi:hypothetical protein
MSSYTSISPDKLSRLIGTANAPPLIDVRIDEHFAVDPHLIQKGEKLAEGKGLRAALDKTASTKT